MNRFEPWQPVEAPVVAVSGDYIFIDINAKSEGVLEKAELAGADGKVSIKEGDKIKAYFLGVQDGEMRFTTKISGEKANKEMLENAWRSGIPVEGHVEKEIKGGYEVLIGSSRAFCPYSQMGYRQKEEPSFFTGKHLTFRIQEYKNDGRDLIVSNRAILEAEHEKAVEDLGKTLTVGTVVTGTVKSLQDYGAFVDINGFQALLPISEIGLERVSDIGSVLAVGQQIQAQIIKTDWEREHVSLSMKALIADPWDNIRQKYQIGLKYSGVISRVMDYGVFVNLEPGVDGLVHVSEFEDLDPNTNLRKVYKPGTKMTVAVKSVDADSHRISLTPASTKEEDATISKYMEGQDDDDGEMYSPFAALLKKK